MHLCNLNQPQRNSCPTDSPKHIIQTFSLHHKHITLYNKLPPRRHLISLSTRAIPKTTSPKAGMLGLNPEAMQSNGLSAKMIADSGKPMPSFRALMMEEETWVIISDGFGSGSGEKIPNQPDPGLQPDSGKSELGFPPKSGSGHPDFFIHSI